VSSEIKLGILGLGVVGSGTVELLRQNADIIEQKTGAKIIIKKIAVRHIDKPRSVNVDRSLLTDNSYEILDDPEIDIVCELIGGIDPAHELVLRALENKKQVVTANKELIAKHGTELMNKANESKLDFQFEGSVGGGIPIIQPMKNALAGNQVQAVMGIVNGTTNYILSQMADENKDFNAALAEAQELGYAEANPTNDIDGHDAAYKLAILSSIAFTTPVDEAAIYREGIAKVQLRDIQVARDLGYVIKLLAIAKSNGNGSIQARVHPTFLPKHHPLAAISGVYNAVYIHGDFVGDVMFYGQGAGSKPTASAVVGDIMDVARNLNNGSTGRVPCTCHELHAITPIEKIVSKYYFRMIATDRPKMLASIANVFGNCGVSIEAVQHRPISRGRIEMVWITHKTEESKFTRSVSHISILSVTEKIANWFRVEEEDI
jgi:homoserine dehydrogenase